MKLHQTQIAIFVCLLIVLDLAANLANASNMKTATCQKTFHTDRSMDVWKGAAPVNITAAQFNSASDVAIYSTDVPSLNLKNVPLIWHKKDQEIYFVNRAIFSELHKASAVDIDKDKEILLGYVTDTKISMEDLASILIASCTVGTFWHLYADVCLESETNSSGTKEAFFSATHEYCTNECKTVQYTFGLRLNVQDKSIWLVGK